MSFAINLMLLLLGTTGALAAFGGETWKKGDDPVLKRVTRRGWLALACMLATLALGIAKEVLSNTSAAESSDRQRALERNLGQTTNELNLARQNLARSSAELREMNERFSKTNGELQDTRAKLAAVEPNILKAMVVATTGLRRESDFSTPSVRGEPVQALRSGRSNSPLRLYGGDLIDYHVFCNSSGGRVAGYPFPNPSREHRLILRAGTTEYPLSDHGRQMIIGPIGQPMEAKLLNPDGVSDCQLKILVESADRTREMAQLEPLIQAINSAKASSVKK